MWPNEVREDQLGRSSVYLDTGLWWAGCSGRFENREEWDKETAKAE